MRRGLARLIVIVLLTAISLMLIYALINWIKSSTSSFEETWQIMPAVYVSHSTAEINESTNQPVLELIIVNQGFGTGKIIRIELWIGDTAYVYIPTQPILIKPRSVERLIVPEPGHSWKVIGSPLPVVPGMHCKVKIYFDNGAIDVYDVVVERSS